MSLIVVAGAAAIVLLLAHNAAFAPAIDAGGPDIVSFELARTPERAEEILDGWGRAGREGAEQAIKIDFGFLVAYSISLGLACTAVASRVKDRWRRFGRLLGWSVPVAGALDGIENLALLRVIDGYHSGAVGSTSPLVAAVVASIKFAIVYVAIGYVVAGVAKLALQRRRG